MRDTIFAVSSGSPPAAIAVLRLSGPDALKAAETLAGSLPEPRRAGVRALRAPDGTLLDRALLLIFPGPASATGEDLVELHLHGGRAVVSVVEATLAAVPGLRRAEPGEFTRRALTLGRIDLSEAEGLGDLLMAETEAQRRVAIGAAEGGVRRQIADWAGRTLALSAHVEAILDHGDEDDVAEAGDPLPQVRAAAATLAREIEDVVARPPVERLRDGVRVALAGPPNIGKSTLFNALAGREAAIVSPVAGTTRDRIEAPVVRDGIPYLLIDTAGLTEASDDPIEIVGVERARIAHAGADVLLWLDDAPPPDRPGVIAVHARADDVARAVAPEGRIAVSGKTGAGLTHLWRVVNQMAQALLPRPDELALNQRQRELSRKAAVALRLAGQLNDPLLIAEEIRTALRAFDRVTGAADVESMLDALFSRFCIGK